MQNQPRRHCMIVFAPYPLGETRVQREAEALVNHGYEVDVICIRLQGENKTDEYKGVKIYREKYRLPFILQTDSGLGDKLLKYLRFFISAGIRITQLHFKKGFSTIQVHNLPDFLVFCTLIPKLLRIPIILDLHDLMPEFYSSLFEYKSSLLLRLIYLQERLSCSYANHVITVSEHWKKALIKRGVPENKCSVVMNVADEQIFHHLDGKHQDSQPRNGFRLIYHGSIHQRYGLDLALQAVDIVRRNISGIHLLLIGEGPHLTTLRTMVKDLGIQANVQIEPLRLAEELPEIIHSCDLGVVPYRNDIFTDGLLPTKLMEYAAMEMPTIAARTTAIQAYFNETNVEFFEPGNANDLARCILNLYDNPERMAELARGSHNFNQRYNWANISEEYVSLVEQLCISDSPLAS